MKFTIFALFLIFACLAQSFASEISLVKCYDACNEKGLDKFCDAIRNSEKSSIRQLAAQCDEAKELRGSENCRVKDNCDARECIINFCLPNQGNFDGELGY